MDFSTENEDCESYSVRKEFLIVISKNEYFEFCPNATEEQWQIFRKQVADIEEKMWAEDHPLDE